MRVKPRKFINYDKYCFFMSHLAHEYKRLGYTEFMKKYKQHICFGVYRKYLDGYLDYLFNQHYGLPVERLRQEEIPKRVVLDPYTYQEYFDFKNKNILKGRLYYAIPEFLKHGILIVTVQEAVKIAPSRKTIFKTQEY